MEPLNVDELKLVDMIARKIWLCRNSIVFGGELLHPSHLVRSAQDLVRYFHKIAPILKHQTVSQELSSTRWKQPPIGFIKFNWNIAVDINKKQMGVGIIARDHEDKVKASLYTIRPYIFDPTTAEAVAVWKVVEFNRDLGFQNIMLERDALEILFAL